MLLGEGPVERVPDADVDRVVLHLEAVRGDLYGDFPLLDYLLLFHWLLAVNFAHFIAYPFSDAETFGC